MINVLDHSRLEELYKKEIRLLHGRNVVSLPPCSFLFFGHPFLDNSGNENIIAVKITESTNISLLLRIKYKSFLSDDEMSKLYI